MAQYFLISIGVLILLQGCSLRPSDSPKLRIVNQSDKSQPSVTLRLSAEDLSAIGNSGYQLRSSYRRSQANCFIVTFPEAPQSFGGCYQRYAQNVTPLDVVYRTNTFAVFVPRSSLVTAATSATLAGVGFMKYGKYKIDVWYETYGKTNSCRFDVDYLRNNAPELHGVWELKDVH